MYVTLITALTIVFDRTTTEEDEICAVARLLGDLVAYRASGTGHLQLLAGMKFHIINYFIVCHAFMYVIVLVK